MNGRRASLLAFLALYVAPAALLLAWRVAPLVAGSQTLFLRDVFNTHLPLKWAQAEAMRGGELPLVDPYRAGGQPLAGNPNAVPFYPDNLLYLATPFLWALNAHFWLHLLLAPAAMYAFGRALGLGRPAAWAAGVCWAFSGFFAAQMSFYNLIAGVALAPALGAAVVVAARGREDPAGRRRARWAAAGAGALWALLLVGGDPLTAVVALAVAASAVFGSPPNSPDPSVDSIRGLKGGEGRPHPREGRWSQVVRRFGPLLPGLAAGTLVALPQIVEFLRIVPLSYRGYRGFSAATRTIASFDPRQTLEWLIPFAFGRPDLLGGGSFWGARFYTDTAPYYFTLYPGLLALALVAAAGLPGRGAGRRRRLNAWAWLTAGAGLFLSLGRFNPLAAILLTLAPTGALRYPIKFWLPVAMAAAVLCGLGFERTVGGGTGGGGLGDKEGGAEGGADAQEGSPTGGEGRGERRTTEQAAASGGLPGRPNQPRPTRLLLPLAMLAAVAAAGWLFLTAAPAAAESLLRGLVPASHPDAFVANERLRWGGLCLLSLGVAALLLAAAALARRRPAAGGALLLAVHSGSQLFFLAPAMPTDEVAPYRQPPALLADVPAGSLVAHGAFDRLFGPSTLAQGTFPERRTRWLERRAFAELYPFAGPLWERRYALNVSPEGLDSFYTRLATAAVEESRDPDRLRLLAAWGVDRLLLDRPLAAELMEGGGGESSDGGGDSAADAVPSGRARLVAARPSFGQTLYVYALPGAAPEVALATAIVRAPHMNAAVAALLADDFDPRTTVVLPGDVEGDEANLDGEPEVGRPEPSGAPSTDAPAPSAARAGPDDAAARNPSAPSQPAEQAAPEARILRRDRERLVAATRSPAPAILVWQRSYLPLYRAAVDGREVEVLVADLHRIGVEVPAGEHEVVVWADRRPLARSALGSLAGVVLLALLALGVGLPGRRRREETP